MAAAKVGLARWTGEAGDPDGAVALLRDVLPQISEVFDRGDDREEITALIEEAITHWREQARRAT